ncbi:hypothetical protein B5M09_012120 [Aphanomyces astaci]|uniref:Uncharacterized protein n=1 Tax=Aphanomyces astaci TaxID=112090 RepID=A0A3R7YI99_APHAT|nr:hypothetical protein B5M09_012120 [Aphanomyces astaci]
MPIALHLNPQVPEQGDDRPSYYDRNRDQVRENQRQYRESNREKIRAIHKAYYLKNRAKITAYKRERWHQKKVGGPMEKDPQVASPQAMNNTSYQESWQPPKRSHHEPPSKMNVDFVLNQ